MSIELKDWSIIIPIENINKCKSLGGFEKFIESQKDRIGHDVWYDEYLYRYRVPESHTGMIFEFWEKEGLQLRNRIVGKSIKYEWKDLCLTTESGPSITCNWLEVDKDVPCAWLKGKPRGELHGSNRKKSKVINESVIKNEYYHRFFEKVYELTNNIQRIPQIFRTVYEIRGKLINNIEMFCGLPKKEPDAFKPRSLYYLLLILLYPIYLIVLLITNCILIFHRRFDVNRFLDVFDLIKLKRGFTLDYEYLYDHPIVYTKRKFPLPNLFKLKTSKHSDVLGPFNFKNIIDLAFEQSPEGYFQFAVFSVVVHQF